MSLLFYYFSIAYFQCFFSRLPYEHLFGGVAAIRTDHFQRVNGYSNSFWGWGGEDDDMYNRLENASLNVTRYPLDFGKYRMLYHKKSQPSTVRFRKSRFSTDGLNSIEYTVSKRAEFHLYTWFYVDLDLQFEMYNNFLYLNFIKKKFYRKIE